MVLKLAPMKTASELRADAARMREFALGVSDPEVLEEIQAMIEELDRRASVLGMATLVHELRADRHDQITLGLGGGDFVRDHAAPFIWHGTPRMARKFRPSRSSLVGHWSRSTSSSPYRVAHLMAVMMALRCVTPPPRGPARS
jgi:hypothetical protein